MYITGYPLLSLSFFLSIPLGEVNAGESFLICSKNQGHHERKIGKKTNIKEIMRKERCKHYEITVSCNFMLTRATELPFVVFYKSVIVVS